MKFENLLYLIIIPILVFLIASIDVQASNLYEITDVVEDSVDALESNETWSGSSSYVRIDAIQRYGGADYHYLYEWDTSDIGSEIVCCYNGSYFCGFYLYNDTICGGAFSTFIPSGYYPVTYTANNGQVSRDGSLACNVDSNTFYSVSISPVKIFDSYEHCRSYLLNGQTDGWTNKPPIDLENDGVMDESIPVPKISFEFNGAVPIGFSLENSSTDYFVEIKGRFYSADDFEYYRTKAGLSGKWQLRFYRTLQGTLDQWVSVNDEKHSFDLFYFETVASDSFNAFLLSNPPENRTFRDPVGSTYYTEVDYPLIFNPESDLKHVLGDIRYALNAKEFYVRYWYEDNGVLKYGKWAHAVQSLPDSDDAEVAYMIDSAETKDLFMQSDKGLTSNDIDSLENTGNSARDKDLVKSYTPSSIDDLSLNSALGEFSNLMHRFGDITTGISGFVVSGMSFFPWWVPYLLGFGIGCVVLLRFIGR